MSQVHRIFGAEVSPYSIKVRSYFRYKSIPHEWIVRGRDTQAEFEKYARLPLIPLVVSPGGRGAQDSTPIIEALEAEHPEPALQPEDPALAFLSALLEEFADEWANKWMFHYRWAREADQQSAADRIARTMSPGLSGEQYAGIRASIVERMRGRVWFVGSSEQTAPQIEAGFREAIEQLARHFDGRDGREGRAYLFGGRPALADFGLWGQLYNAWSDPTPGALIEERAPGLKPWLERMLDPQAQGEFETWDALEPTLAPFLERHVAGAFLPWSDANARALASGREEFSVELPGGTWTQKPQKYHAKSLAALRARYAAARSPALDAILERTGCLRWLRE